jgi:hypothetical protein
MYANAVVSVASDASHPVTALLSADPTAAIGLSRVLAHHPDTTLLSRLTSAVPHLSSSALPAETCEVCGAAPASSGARVCSSARPHAMVRCAVTGVLCSDQSTVRCSVCRCALQQSVCLPHSPWRRLHPSRDTLAVGACPVCYSDLSVTPQSSILL